MKYFSSVAIWSIYAILIMSLLSCKDKNASPSAEMISEINLKRGNLISCGVLDNQFGTVVFETACNEKVKGDFNLAVELLHSFEYDESEKVFAKIIDATPDCAMAFWGVAMCNFHPLWNPPTEPELIKGAKAIGIAKSIIKKSKRESAYINALSFFYGNWSKDDHLTRCRNYEKAMEKVHLEFPDDKEAAIFYALALDASANPKDKSYANQLKAGKILNELYPSEPNHPGVIHYIIHTYDYPGLAEKALSEARHYAQVAPSSAHALHMPSHIFTRLGLWEECIQSNQASVASAKCYAEQAGIKGHWDEELHGLDYLVYAYLQRGDNKHAKEQMDYLATIKNVYPTNFKVAYAYAAIPARIFLENRNWKAAAAIQKIPESFPWAKFPWQESIIHYARLLGSAQLGKMDEAHSALTRMKQLHDTLVMQKDSYKSDQVAIQVTTGEAWIQFAKGNIQQALILMKQAAEMEDATEKNPVTPGEILPARELLGDMLFRAGQYNNALQTYVAALKKSPNRFNSLYGAGIAAEKSGHQILANTYYRQLSKMIDPINGNRPELVKIHSYLAMK